jgi:hypothetical protein
MIQGGGKTVSSEVHKITSCSLNEEELPQAGYFTNLNAGQ